MIDIAELAEPLDVVASGRRHGTGDEVDGYAHWKHVLHVLNPRNDCQAAR